MNKTILLIIFLLPIIGSCQNQSFDINVNSLSDYIKKEKEFVGGKILDSDCLTIYDELGLVSYIRSDNSVPDLDLIVRYVYFKKDSLIKEIRNEWDISNGNKKINNTKDLKFRKSLVSFYSQLENTLVTNYGKSKTKGKLPNEITKIDDYCKTNEWNLGNTIVKLKITMSNVYDKNKNLFPTHKVILSYRAIDLKNKTNYKGKELLKRIRKEIPNIENPIIGSPQPIYPNCENSKDKYSCMYNKIQELIINEVKSKNMFIKNDTLKVGFMIEINGKTKPWKHSIKSNNKELEKIGLEVIENLPIMKPSYSEKMKQNVTSGNTFYVIIKDNEVINKFK